MKIVKHVDSELYAGMSEVAGEACQGYLTGEFLLLVLTVNQSLLPSVLLSFAILLCRAGINGGKKIRNNELFSDGSYGTSHGRRRKRSN